MTFHVIDKTTGREPDLEKIALTEDWASHLMYCDMSGFALEEDGNLILMDDCGNVAYCPVDRFEIMFDGGWHKGTPTDDGWYLVWMGAINGNLHERPAVVPFENGDWASHLVSNTYVAWQKIEPFEEASK